MVKTLSSTAGGVCLIPGRGVCLIPGRGAKIPHASGTKKQNIKQKRYGNKFDKDFKNGLHLKTLLKTL